MKHFIKSVAAAGVLAVASSAAYAGGFASTEEGNKLTADDQRKKLDLVVKTAEKVWGGVAI